MQTEWLDADETASSLQITRATLYKLIREGSVPARKVSGRWRVSREHIEELFATAGLSEVRVAMLLEDAAFHPPAGIRLGYLPSPGGVRLRLAAPHGAPDAQLDRAAAEVRTLLGASALPGISLPEGVVEAFQRHLAAFEAGQPVREP